MHSHSFQDTELKLCMWVKDNQGQVVEGLKILGVHRGGGGHTYVVKGPGNAGQPS